MKKLLTVVVSAIVCLSCANYEPVSTVREAPPIESRQTIVEVPPSEPKQAIVEVPPSEPKQATVEVPPSEPKQATVEVPPSEPKQATVEVPPSEPKQATVEVPPPVTVQKISSSDAILASAYSRRQSKLQVSGQGFVTRLLADDADRVGGRHQRFLLTLASGQTLLIAHNIDIAPRIQRLKQGDFVQFYGEYAWNAEGGVIHWTHRDPGGRHVAGGLQHGGLWYY